LIAIRYLLVVSGAVPARREKESSIEGEVAGTSPLIHTTIIPYWGVLVADFYILAKILTILVKYLLNGLTRYRVEKIQIRI